tara:strand:+ start:163 stop:321 length:159 start_codon:yes stop_codon:yes gene_type:complete
MYINHLDASPSLALQHPKYLNKLKIDMAKKILPVTRQGHAVKEGKANELRLE